jgi:hypothetical protein
MSDTPDTSNPYAAVLADLRAKRQKIDNTIEFLEEFSRMSLVSTPDGLQFTRNDEVSVPEEGAGTFLGMSIVDAAKKLLGLRKRAMTNTEILVELQAGGLVLTGADPLNVVGSVLTRRFNNVGDVVRVNRGTWGLKEWYPGRNFKPANKASAMIAEAVGGEGDTASNEGEPAIAADPLSAEAIAAFGRVVADTTRHG